MFDERKVAQMAAYLLAKEGGSMPHLKLMKLLYLADRESLGRYGTPISGDHVVAMEHGPVLSMTLDLINGFVRPSKNGWESWISAKANYQVSLKRTPSLELLDELSVADINALDTVWSKFGHMDKWEIRDYTHDHCPEWKDPDESSVPIPYANILQALGKTPEVASELSARIEAKRSLDKLLASL